MSEQRADNLTTKHIRVHGIVQGVGFRPFVSRTAMRLGLTGTVANRGSYVEIFLRGEENSLRGFLYELEHNAPPRSVVLKVDERDCEDIPFTSFDIIYSKKEAGDIFVSPDIATCPKCREELFDPKNRRYLHPFINCTSCGPRVTILDGMPYDRERTSMKEFPMCPDCAREYYSPGSRRYDAQPVCCNKCGPEVYLLGRSERGSAAITMARLAIRDGQIIAVKGIGGFHLCCDATNEEAVSLLRERKSRPAKPFAVMMRDMEAVDAACVLSETERDILDGPQKPILLLKRKADCSLAPSVAPDNPDVGVMLPYAPVQMLLFDYKDEVDLKTDCFVMTSGNVSGAPICRTEEDAMAELSGFCDLILSHDRKIRLRADDSVMSFYRGEPYMIRRSRGFAPLPVMMETDWSGDVLAIGGELKNTFCIGRNRLFYPSPYVGDMEDIRTVQALTESVYRMEELLEAQPGAIVCDLHPGYHTTTVAKELAEEAKVPLLQVQHHYAHILSCMAENDVPVGERVIGVSFDGTGYGTDGTIWGGEILTADYTDYQRVGSIVPFLQIGGDASAREGWRIAVAMIQALDPEHAEELISGLNLCDEETRRVYLQMAEKQINTVISTSAGRLFDAAAAILGIRLRSTFEGEAATTLEFRAEEYKPDYNAWKETRKTGGDEAGRAAASVPVDPVHAIEDGRLLLPTDEIVRWLVEQRLAGADIRQLAYEFHEILARQIVAACQAISQETGIRACALSGGVFQNRLLLRLCEDGLTAAGLMVYRHRLIPPNDGGLSLGQAVYAQALLNCT